MVDQVKAKTGDKMDVVLAITAHEAGAVFVTDDTTLRNKCQRLGIEFWTSSELFQKLNSLNS
jgi:predicted DNA-binding protein (UPF0278 family)